MRLLVAACLLFAACAAPPPPVVPEGSRDLSPQPGSGAQKSNVYWRNQPTGAPASAPASAPVAPAQ